MAEGGSGPVQSASNTRGIRVARWLFAGNRDRHVVEVLSRGLDSRRLETWVDGQFVVAAARPSHPDPWAITEVGEIDGYEVCVGVASRRAGAAVCDLFVDGISLTTAEPISVVVERPELSEVNSARSWLRQDDGSLHVAGCFCLTLLTLLAMFAVGYVFSILYALANWGY